MVRKNTPIFTLILYVIVFMCVFSMAFIKPCVFAAQLMPEENQYLEFKVTSVEKIEGKDKQVIAELWAYNIEFTAIDLNLYYDNSKLKPSNIETNDYISEEDAEDGNMFWKTEEFKENLDVWFMEYMPDWLQYIFSIFFSETIENQHIYTGTNSNGEEYISIRAGEEGVLLGTFSYRLFNGKVDESTFGLKQTPEQETGIQVIIDDIDEYVDPSIFRVSLEFASSNANLIDIKIDDNSIENFDKETLIYDITINKLKDSIELLPIPEDERARIKVKKRLDDGEYEEISLNDGSETYAITLNELGKETKIEIEVLAEDRRNAKSV